MENTVVKKERFYHFDITRAFSIMLLPTIHIFEELELQEMLAENVVNNWRIPILYLCMFAPSLFMILFGANLKFAKELTPEEYAKRGVHFLLLGAILNVLRFGLPAIIGVFTGQPMLFYSFLADLMQPDIYDFIGLFLLLFALMKKLRINEWWMLFISLTLLTINNWIPSFDTGSLLLNNFLGRFLYIDENSCFSLMAWTIFPIIGYVFAILYSKITDAKKRTGLHIYLFFVGLVLESAFDASFDKYGQDWKMYYISPANNYFTEIINTILMTAVAVFVFSFFYFLYKWFSNSKLVEFLLKISKWIMPFYFIQWIIVGWIESGMIIAKAPTGCVNTVGFILLIVGVTLATILLTFLFGDKINQLLKYKSKKQS